MGGLVIKKAYIIAKTSHEYASIAIRTKAMFFLATPHRGSDLAPTFTRILNLTLGSRPFVMDLHRNSLITQSINDEFPAICNELQLYSFYETIPSAIGPVKVMVVERDMATLGYRNERTAYLNADHRHVVKYMKPDNINYKTVRNAIAATIRAFRQEELLSDDKSDVAGLRKQLNICLGVSEAPADKLWEVESRRMPGSCEWILRKSAFSEWRDSLNPWTYWISASPATGKSILCGFVIKHLRDAGLNCSYYFFTHGDKVKARITSCLLSMAWQMATTQRDIMQTVIDICNKDGGISASTDHRTVWRKLFVEGILRVKLQRRHFWLIDALDECKEDAEFIPYLMKLNDTCDVRAFVTHRRRFEAPKNLGTSMAKVYAETIGPEETKADIALYLQENIQNLPPSTDEERKDMVNKILEKSAGCFLWVHLVLQELSKVQTLSATQRILEEIPSDMDFLYSRILTSMAAEDRGTEMALAIFHWVVCSARPLTLEELHDALELDLGDTIYNMERLIEITCGQLVYIDTQSRVHFIHETARDYLLRERDSEFAIERSVGHKRLALTCLKYLAGPGMVGGNKRRASSSIMSPNRSPFVAYASKYLSDHITFIHSTDDEFIVTLAGFLSSPNVLSWIEYMATQKDLHRLMQTGKAIAHLLRRRSKHMSLIGEEVARIDSWSIDLVRLATKFGKSLSASPSSIYSLIPPFCPAESALRKQFGKSPREISVHGLSSKGWDDCLSTIYFPDAYVSALGSSDKFFAVGLDTGKVHVYHDATCQEANVVDHGEAVRIIIFSTFTDTMATCGLKTLKIWSLDSWTLTWRFELSHMCMSLIFAEDDQILLAAMKDNNLVEWNLETGLSMEPVEWTVDGDGRPSKQFRRPSYISMNAGQGLLAAIYCGQDVVVWDLSGRFLYETYNRDTGLSTSGDSRQNTRQYAVVLNPAPESTLFAVTYFEGDIVVFNTADGTVVESVNVGAQSMAASPDGRSLATFDSSGTIQVLDFETLKTSCRIQSRDWGIKAICFNGDSSRLLVGRGSQCKIWNPPALVRNEDEDDNSDTVSVSTAPQDVKYDDSGEEVLITAICAHDSGAIFLCGKEDGSVCLYNTKDGQQVKVLYKHAGGAFILFLFADPTSQTIGSAASSGHIMTHKLSRTGSDWQIGTPLFDRKPGFAIEQILSNNGYTRMLVCSRDVDTLYDVSSGRNITIQVKKRDSESRHRWAAHPNNRELIMITGSTAHIYHWDNFQQKTGDSGILLSGSSLAGSTIESITPCYNGLIISTAFSHYQRTHKRSNLLLYPTSSFQALASSPQAAATATPVPKSQSLSAQVEYLIGAYARRLVFLHASGWICSTDQETFTITRHFFVPSDWLSSNLELLIRVTKHGDILFVRGDEVAVIKMGLEGSGAGMVARAGRRPVLRGDEKNSSG
jgi:WD40 repeat protein